MTKGKRPVISYSEIVDKKGKGMTQTEIAKEVGVTRAYISWIIKEYGPPKELSPREKAMREGYPWKVSTEHVGTHLNRLTRDHVDYVVNGTGDMTPDRVQRLRALYEYLDKFDVVVEYDPNNPPTPSSPSGGFEYRPREESDGDLIIRVNDYADLTNKSLKLWRKPKRLPESKA